MGSRQNAATVLPPEETGQEADPAYRRGFADGLAAGLSSAHVAWQVALEQAETELQKFKAKDHEFYAHVRLNMAGLFEAKAAGARGIDALRAAATAEAIRRDVQAEERAVLEQLRVSRLRGIERKQRDAEQVTEFARLIRSGEVTKTAAAKLNCGMERAKRLRRLAVERGLLARRR